MFLNAERRGCALALACGMMLMPLAAAQQALPAAGAQLPPQVHVVPMQHAIAAYLSERLSGLYGPEVRISFDERSNSLLIALPAGASDAFTKSVLDFAHSLDQAPSDAMETRVLELPAKLSDVQQQQLIAALVKSTDGTVQASLSNGALVATGATRSLDRVSRTLHELVGVAIKRGSAQSQLRVTLFVLSGSFSPEAQSHPLPDRLAAVKDSLAEQGLFNLRLGGTLTFAAESGEAFRATGSAVGLEMFQVEIFAEWVEGGDPLAARIRGEYDFRAAAPFAAAAPPPNPRGPQRGPSLSVQSTAIVPVGDYLVLATAPSEAGDADAMVLVVHVQPASSRWPAGGR